MNSDLTAQKPQAKALSTLQRRSPRTMNANIIPTAIEVNVRKDTHDDLIQLQYKAMQQPSFSGYLKYSPRFVAYDEPILTPKQKPTRPPAMDPGRLSQQQALLERFTPDRSYDNTNENGSSHNDAESRQKMVVPDAKRAIADGMIATD